MKGVLTNVFARRVKVVEMVEVRECGEEALGSLLPEAEKVLRRVKHQEFTVEAAQDS